MKIEKDFREGYIKVSYKRIAIWFFSEWICPHKSWSIDFVQMGYLKRWNSKNISITLLGFSIGLTLYDKT